MKTVMNNTVSVDVAKAQVKVMYPDGSEQVEEIPVVEQIVTKPLANIGYSAQITKSMGNYESAKVSVSLHIPTEVENLEATYGFITEWVDTKMNSLIEMLNAAK